MRFTHVIGSYVALLLLLIFVIWITLIICVLVHVSHTSTADSNRNVVATNKEKKVWSVSSFHKQIIIQSNETYAPGQLNFEKQLKRSQAGLDLYRYRWTILERDFCSKRYPNLFLLIIVHTAVSHVKERQAIREMYGDIRLYDKYKTAVIFALGETANETIRRMIRQESIRYRDIIQQNFPDAYKLLVLKGLMWMRFVAEYCPKVPLILKLDDDVAVNYFGVLRFLNIYIRRKLLPHRRMILCRVFPYSRPKRNETNKWYISLTEYPDHLYSTYCGGLAFILTSDLIRPMMKKAQKGRFIWVDDFYLTGYLTADANVTFEDIGSLYEEHPAEVEVSMSRGLKLFGLVRSVDQHKRVWKRIPK